MEITGRRPEVDRITTLATLPRESALVLIGDPGSGRTSVLDAASTRVPVPVVRIDVNTGESRWPTSGVASFLTALAEAVPGPPDVPRPSGDRTAPPEGTGLAVAQALVDTVRGMQLPPTLVLVDDLDRMDPESQERIAFLAGHLRGTGLRLVATARPATDGPLTALPTLRLEGLGADEAVLLARDMAPEDANDGVLAVVAEQSAGNPGVLRDHLRALRHAQLVGTEPLVLPLRPSPSGVAAARRALHGADDAELLVLTRLALVPTAHLAVDDTARDVVEDLAGADLVTVLGQSVRITSPVVRSYLYWAASARERRTLHAELAGQAVGTDPRAAVWHRSFVDETPDAVALLGAARAYAVDGDAPAAVAVTERALQVGIGGEEAHVALLGVAEVLLAHRLLSAAARYLAVIRPFRAVPDEVRRLRLWSSVRFLSGDAVDADELFVTVEVPDSDGSDAVAGLLAMVACFHAEAWELDRARDLLDRARSLSPQASPHTRGILTAAQEVVDAVDGTLPADRDLHGGLATAELLAMSDPALLLLAHALSLAERYRSARRVFATVLGRAAHTSPVWVEAARYLSAENEVRSGNLRQALRAIDTWESGSAVVERLREPSRAIAVAWRHFIEGRTEECLDVIDHCLAHRSTNRLWGATAKLHSLRGRVLLLEGRLDEAASALEAADAIGRSLRNPTILRHLGDLAETYVRLGRLDDARTVAARLTADHHARPSRWGALVLARTLALVADDASREAARQRALQTFTPSDSAFEHARTLAALATVHAGADRSRLLSAAAAAYAAAGIRRPLVAAVAVGSTAPARIVSAPPASPGPVRSPGSPVAPLDGVPAALTQLTAEERAVVQKVTEGYKNREIASSLYMSQRTVELRLTQIYRKVGARSRSHLVALLA